MTANAKSQPTPLRPEYFLEAPSPLKPLQLRLALIDLLQEGWCALRSIEAVAQVDRAAYYNGAQIVVSELGDGWWYLQVVRRLDGEEAEEETGRERDDTGSLDHHPPDRDRRLSLGGPPEGV